MLLKNVAYNGYRRILKFTPRSNASTMYSVNHIDSFEILVRKRVVGFIERLKVCNKSIISCIDNSWKMRFDIKLWNPWIKLLYTQEIVFLYQCSTLYNFMFIVL